MVSRKQTEITVLIIILLNLLFLSGGCSSSKTTDSSYYSTDSVRSGDIILRKSYGLISEIIVAQLKDTIGISHCGIIVKNPSKEIKVIHSLSKKVSDVDGIQISTIEDFMNDSRIETVRVVRFRNDTTGKIAEQACWLLKRKIPFDEDFNLADTSALYCSELPIQIIKNCFEIDISQRAGIPKFSIFLNSDNFREIEFIKKRAVKKPTRFL
ncbi:MAG: YiiX/YebB-like N1pC/P60 family cysteine hydrolase [Paludibacter sp.]|nr:YiiX/YebB-like N1pC/P60 family cysteine hydrolase [Paludibacter sp.]